MIVSIHQPAYLPWLGYFDRIAKSDLHIVLDHVQYEKNSYINRTRILGAQWLTIPVKQGKRPITEVEIADLPWRGRHEKTLIQVYGKFPWFSEYLVQLLAINSEGNMLMEVLRPQLKYLLIILDIHTPILYSSELKTRGHKTDLVVGLCREVNATVYLSGPQGRDYLDEKAFGDIKVEYHDYAHPIYDQGHRIFQSHLSVIDLLFNHGPESLKILTK